MAGESSLKTQRTIPIVVLIVFFALSPVRAQAQNSVPVVDAGLSRYAGPDPVVLDGTGSYDPDNSGTLSYTWRQISGPAATITDTNTATPTISGFVQTDEIQECEFELVVSDGELTSIPDTVKVIIVPDFGENIPRLVNDSFDLNKPTCVWFWGGDGIIGLPFQPAWASEESVWWPSKANLIEFSKGYEPDPNYTPGDVDELRTYYRCGDMIIVFLSSVAPDYKMPIQTIGFSLGGQPAIDVGIHLNLTYADARYAVNRVTLLDARAGRDFSDSILQFLDSAVDGEQCWIDNHRGGTDGPRPSLPSFYPNVLRVGSSLSHTGVPTWYVNSLTNSDMNEF
ncbi:MAG: PKD domain-containing protein, partial [Planctomycetota bacterium]